jgi:hypothetical protein
MVRLQFRSRFHQSAVDGTRKGVEAPYFSRTRPTNIEPSYPRSPRPQETRFTSENSVGLSKIPGRKRLSFVRGKPFYYGRFRVLAGAGSGASPGDFP